MKKLLLFLTIFIYIDVFGVEVSLDRCVDGDTAWFITNETSLKYRFLAIDTPETVHPSLDFKIYGKNASDYTCNLLKTAKKIEIEYDDKSTKTDKYNRELVWVFVDKKLLQEILIENGYAKVAYIYGNYKYVSLLKEKEIIAKEEKVGIWGNIYSVTYKYKDKTYKEDVVGGTIIEPYKLNKEYEKDFIGWFYKNKPYEFNSPINEDIELIGKYKENPMLFRIIIIILFLIVLYFIDKKEFDRQIKIRNRLFE